MQRPRPNTGDTGESRPQARPHGAQQTELHSHGDKEAAMNYVDVCTRGEMGGGPTAAGGHQSRKLGRQLGHVYWQVDVYWY